MNGITKGWFLMFLIGLALTTISNPGGQLCFIGGTIIGILDTLIGED